MPRDAAAPLSPSGRPLRIEYMSFVNAGDHREFRYAVHGPDGVIEKVFRIALSAFGSAHLRLQDGPDICYQALIKVLAAGEMDNQIITIGEGELGGYVTAHTPAPKRRAAPPNVAAKPAMEHQRPLPPRPRAPLMPVAPPRVVHISPPRFGEGQRVLHSIYGEGVTGATSDGRTSISFDQGGARAFVTAMLDVEVLSGPGTWETTVRGKNRPRETDPAR